MTLNVDNKSQYDKKIIIKLIVHHVLLMLMVIIIVFAVAYAYYAMQESEVKMPKSEQSKGAAHPLPEFIVDKIKPDDLRDLKP